MYKRQIEGQGLDQLLNNLSDHLSRQDIRLQIELSYQDQKALDFVYKNGQVFETDYRTEGVAVAVRLPSRHIKRLTEMLVHSTYTSEVYRVERAINC